MVYSTVLDRLRFRLLGIAIVRCKPKFGWVVKNKLFSHSLHDIVISVQLWPTKKKIMISALQLAKKKLSTEVLTTPEQTHLLWVFPEHEIGPPTKLQKPQRLITNKSFQLETIPQNICKFAMPPRMIRIRNTCVPVQ